jgi:NAD(P)-dependent dehydrogenase (short-subunit alcohol dehydrogenase family)
MALNPRLQTWRGQRVWLIGASSGIGLACAQALHAAGAQVCVSARQSAALDEFVAQHPGARALAMDVTDANSVAQASAAAWATQGLDWVVYCAGHYRAHDAAHFDLADMLRHQDVNYTGALRVLDVLLPRLLAQGHGHVSLVSSVAGYRGLPKSLAYGPTKAALSHLAEVLYFDLHPRGLGVSVVCPGFVQTPLTAQNDFHMPALMRPADAAQCMLQGWQRGLFEIHFPKRFTRWMKLLQILPCAWYFPLVARLTRTRP